LITALEVPQFETTKFVDFSLWNKLSLKHWWAIIVVNAAWGSGFLSIKMNVVHFGPYLSLSIRYAGLILLLLPFLRGFPSENRIAFLQVTCLMGILHFGLGMTSFHLAVDITSLALASQAYIPISAILAMIFLKEELTWSVGLGIGLAFLGFFVMSFDPVIFTQLNSMLIMLAATAVMAVSSLLVRHKLKGINPLTLQAWTGLSGLLPIFMLSLYAEQEHWQKLESATWINWISVLHAVIFSSILGHGINFWLLQQQPVSRITPYYLLTPICAVLMAILFWGDQPGPRIWFGGAMILFGILLVSTNVNLKKWRKA
jgi:O-acetylserine/cysteine efflux transporter